MAHIHNCTKEEFSNALPQFLFDLFTAYDEDEEIEDEVFIFGEDGIAIQVKNDMFIYLRLHREGDDFVADENAYAEEIYDEKWFTMEEGFHTQSCWLYTIEDLKEKGFI